MNNVFRSLIAFSTIGVSALCAASLEPIRVSVPFAFSAGKTSLPAGEYTITEQDSKVLVIRGSHGSAILLEDSVSGEIANSSSLSFRHTGDGYFLQGVHSFGRRAATVPVNLPAGK